MEATSIAARAADQRMSSLAKANDTRRRTVEARTALSRRELNFADALEHPDLQPERLYRVVRALPGYGRIGETRFVRAAGLLDTALHRRLRDLTPRQKAALVAAYRPRRVSSGR